MRMLVKYVKPGQIEGARLFDIPAHASREAVAIAAKQVAGPDAQVVDVIANDGTVPFERRVVAKGLTRKPRPTGRA